MSKNVVRYAQLHDTTVRRHWEAAGRVDIRGSTITFDPNGALADARPMLVTATASAICRSDCRRRPSADVAACAPLNPVAVPGRARG